MSEKQFSIVGEEYVGYTQGNAYIINNGECKFSVWESEEDAQKVCNFMNEQQVTINKLKEENEQLRKYNKQLKERLEKINGGYGHLTHRNGLTANEWLIESQERELKKKNEQISDWIERHSKDIAIICEQQATISRLEEENEQLQKENSILNRNEDDLKECTLENIQLKEENEQLRNELDNFNPVMFQDMRYGTVTLYSKGGIDE